MNLLLPLLRTLADRLPVAAITGPGDDPHLCRYLLCEWVTEKSHVRLYLQRILRSDPAFMLHDHPWAFAASLILAGGYREERYAGPYTGMPGATRVFRPGSVNRFGPRRLHRIDLLDGESWSLLLTGPVVQSWRFWSARSGEWISWRKYFRREGMAASWQPVPVGRMA